jgi:hypothetical protein
VEYQIRQAVVDLALRGQTRRDVAQQGALVRPHGLTLGAESMTLRAQKCGVVAEPHGLRA